MAYKREDENWILAKLVERNSNRDYSTEFPKVIPTDFQRGYPYTFLEDRDEWRVMEQDSKSNMVLSSQQVDIVSQKQIRYPLFLTGRAGSGKSTLLQYLFAEVILRYINSRDNVGIELKAPVYLSYSSNLIDDAKNCVQRCLRKTTYTRKHWRIRMSTTRKTYNHFYPRCFMFSRLYCATALRRSTPEKLIKSFLTVSIYRFPSSIQCGRKNSAR